jgi:hypothetical protein
LFVGNLFHPIRRITIEPFYNGNVRHGSSCRGAVPMFFTRWKPDDVTGPNFFDGAAPTLSQAAACRYDQSLTQRMGVPRCASTRLECNAGGKHASWTVRFDQGINADGAGKIFGWSFAGRLGARSSNIHGVVEKWSDGEMEKWRDEVMG